MTDSPEPTQQATAASSGLRRWLGKGSLALIDQLLYSVSNWILQILLARWLADEVAYGSFAIGWQVFLIFAIFHNAIVIDPMLVFGSKDFADRKKEYLGALIAQSVGVATTGTLILSATAWIYYLRGIAGSSGILAFGVAAPCILVWWMARRSSYMRGAPVQAVVAGSLYLVFILGGAFVLHWADWLGPISATVLFAVASLPAASLIAVWEGARPPDATLIKTALLKHWRYGRWAIVTQLTAILPERLFYFAMPIAFTGKGTAMVGVLQAMQNLFQPFTQLGTAAIGIFIPSVVRAIESGQRRRLRKLLAVSVAVLALPALAWAGFMFFFGGWLIHTLYDGTYDSYGHLLPILALAPVATGVTIGLYPLFAALERLDLCAVAGLFALLFSATIGLVLMMKFELTGVAWTISASAAILALSYCVIAVWQLSNHPRLLPYSQSEHRPNQADV